MSVSITPSFEAVDPPEGYDDGRFMAASEGVEFAVTALLAAGASSENVEHSVDTAIKDTVG